MICEYCEFDKDGQEMHSKYMCIDCLKEKQKDWTHKYKMKKCEYFYYGIPQGQLPVFKINSVMLKQPIAYRGKHATT